MTTLITVDETSGVQNSEGGVTSNDTNASLPLLFQDALAFEGAGGGTVDSLALSGVDGTLANSGGVNVMTFGANVTDVAFTDGSGNALDGADSGLTTTDGTAIYLYTSTFDNNVVVGRKGGSGGDVVFAAYLDTGVDTGSGDPGATGAKLWLAQFESMFQPDGTDPNDIVYLSGVLNVSVNSFSNFSLAGAPSGQNLFMMFGDGTPDPSETSIVVTGWHPANQSTGASVTSGDTVNTGQGGGMTTIGSNNQMIDPNEAMYFTFVKGANTNYTVPNLDQNEADVEANIDFTDYAGAQSASFSLVQLQPPKGATVKIAAFNNTDTSEIGTSYIDGLGDADDLAVNIDEVTVTRMVKVGKSLVETSYSFSEGSNTPQGGLTLNFAGDTVTITGAKAGDRIEYHSVTDHNRVLITNLGNATSNLNASFDIGGFQLAEGNLSTTGLGDVAFVDDAPTASIVRTLNTMALDETQGAKAGDANAALDDITGSNIDPFSGAYGVPIGALSGVDLADSTTDFGVDTAGATSIVSLSITNGDGSDSGLKTTDGTEIDLWVEADGSITGRTGGASGTVIIAIKIDNDGLVSVAQYASLQHPTPGTSDDEQVTLAGMVDAVVTATDGDGDSDTASVDIGAAIGFDDDGPVAFTPDDITLTNTGSDSGTENLNDGSASGADAPGTVAWVDNDVADDYLRDTNGVLLTSDGENIVLGGWGTGTLTATTESSLQTVFTATLDDPSSGQYTVTFDKAIDDGGGINFLGAAPVKSGNPTYNLINNVDSTTLDLLFSGGDVNGGAPSGHSVNVSTTGAGTDNQSMNPGETLRIDFANGASLAGSPLGSDFVLGTHQTVNGFSFLISQNTPSGTTGTAYIKAIDADGDKTLVGDAGDVADVITKVLVNGLTVMDGGVATDQTINGHLVHAIAYNGGVVLTGLNEGATGDGTGGDDPVVKVYTADGFNRVEVSNYSGQNVGGVLGGTSFDIAPAGVDQAVQGTQFAFDLPVQMTDADGDTGPVELIGVTVDPVPVV
jgi:hypothetical protein